MKLTKGKISKLYNKKRQTLKKLKKGKTSHKRRTFRKRKINLARKTLKRFNYKKYKGGLNGAKEQVAPEVEQVIPEAQEQVAQEQVVQEQVVATIVTAMPVIEIPASDVQALVQVIRLNENE